MSDAVIVVSLYVGGLALVAVAWARLGAWARTSPRQARWNRAAKRRRRMERRASRDRR